VRKKAYTYRQKRTNSNSNGEGTAPENESTPFHFFVKGISLIAKTIVGGNRLMA